MLTILEAIKLSTEFLEKKGIESPRINAELLLSHILKCKRLNLYLTFDRPLKESELNDYRELLRRRGKAEPLQYIIGEIEFYGIPLKVNRSVLIPRQETEILVETIIEHCRSISNCKILDIGTGSGNIAIALAKNLPDSLITAIDNSAEALHIAEINTSDNSVADRINFILTDIRKDEKVIADDYDVVVSNPPYISLDEYHTLRPELKVYEPAAALTDYSDGFSFYKDISSGAGSWLKKGGTLYFELAEGQSGDVEKLMRDNSFHNIKIVKDYLGIERVISGELY